MIPIGVAIPTNQACFRMKNMAAWPRFARYGETRKTTNTMNFWASLLGKRKCPKQKNLYQCSEAIN